MKKTLLSLAVAGLALGSANAQLPVGSVAPDWTLTDINGVSHHLYDYLDQGYTVLIDISAAWCGPCWSAHNSGFMKNLYNQYGPTGTVTPGKLMVIYVEGESTNTTAQLTGTSSGSSYATFSQGDWVTGEPYKFIDNSSLNTTYQIGGFPTFTLVCPNRRVGYAVSGFGSAMAQTSYWTPYIDQCPIAVTGPNVGTIGVMTPTSVCAGGPTALKAEIQNLGSTTLTAATVVAKVAGNTIATINWTGSLAKYASAVVNLGNYTFTNPSTVVTYEATTTNDALSTDNTKMLTSESLSSNYKTWILEVKTDQYPGETSWKVKNSGGTVVQQHAYTAGTGQNGSGGPDAGKVFTHALNLNASECYTVEVLDSYGDGLYGVQSAADTGYIKLKDGAQGLIFNFGGGYGEGTSRIVKSGTQTTGIEELISQNDFSVYPNPVDGQLNVKTTMLKSAKVSFTIVNLLGQQVMPSVEKSLTNGQNITTINTSGLNAGIYFLNITTEKGNVQQKFVKK